MKRLNFDALCSAIAVACLIALGTSTVKAITATGTPAACGDDHCQPASPYACGRQGCIAMVTIGSGSKNCCVAIIDQYGHVVAHRIAPISYTDYFCHLDCDGDGVATYVGCTYSASVGTPTATPC